MTDDAVPTAEPPRTGPGLGLTPGSGLTFDPHWTGGPPSASAGGSAPHYTAGGGPFAPAGEPAPASPGLPATPGAFADPQPALSSGTLSGSGPYTDLPAGRPTRHPADPDEARSTKAAAVLALGVAAVITGPLVGGVVPAVLGLVLAREARDDLIAGKGYLTGGRQLRLGVTLAWVGIALAVAALVAASVVGILSLAAGTAHDFPDTSD